MKKAMVLGFLALLITSSASAMVVKGYDAVKSCDLYKVVPTASESDDVVVYAKEAYGLSFQDMEVNFDKREVLVQPMINIIMGVNRPLLTSKAIVTAENPDFNFLVNQLNRKISLFEKICISDGKIVYAKMFE